MLWLKFVCPILVLCIIWIWNRYRREKRKREERERIVPCLEFCVLSDDIRDELGVDREILEKLESTTKVYRIMLGNKTMALALFSWPSSLWRFRVDRGEEESLGAHSHIHWITVLDNEYLERLIDNIISDTRRISAGITIDLGDPELKELFKQKFEFEDFGTYMKLDYDNRSRL